MGVQIIPPWIQPNAERQEWIDDNGVPFRPEFGAGLTQRQSFGGLRIRLTRRHRVRQEELAYLLAALIDTDGAYNTVYTTIHKTRRGSLSSTQRLSNPTFANGATDWSTSDAANTTIHAIDRVLRAFRVAVTLAADVRATAFSETGNNRWAARAFVRSGRGSLSHQLRLGTTAGGSEISAGATLTSPGLATITGQLNSATVNFAIRDNTTGKSAGDFMDIPYTAVTRCLFVSGSGQTGSAINVDTGPASIDGVLRAGDWFEINGELKMATASLNMNSSGQGYLMFKPELFRSPVDNDPVIVTEPLGKFIVTDVNVDPRFGTDADVEYVLEQIYE